MITKRVSNSGAMGGAGVQQIDVKAEIRKELKKQTDEMVDSYSKRVCQCPWCGEKYRISPRNTSYQAKVLWFHFKEERCPFCKISEKTGNQNFGYAVENKFKCLEFQFEAWDNDFKVTHQINVVRVPEGYRKAPLEIIIED